MNSEALSERLGKKSQIFDTSTRTGVPNPIRPAFGSKPLESTECIHTEEWRKLQYKGK